MKQLNHTILLLGMMLLAVGCTLYLDEPVPDGGEDTLNGDGFSSPKTQLTEFGDVTYQFEEGVRASMRNTCLTSFIAATIRQCIILKSFLPRTSPETLSPGEANISPRQCPSSSSRLFAMKSISLRSHRAAIL